MSRYLASACLFFFSVTGYCLPSPTSEGAMQLADKGVVGTDANGDSQTTMMDVNGNLKMVPVDPKAQQKTKQNNNNNSSGPNGPGPGAMNEETTTQAAQERMPSDNAPAPSADLVQNKLNVDRMPPVDDGQPQTAPEAVKPTVPSQSE